MAAQSVCEPCDDSLDGWHLRRHQLRNGPKNPRIGYSDGARWTEDQCPGHGPAPRSCAKACFWLSAVWVWDSRRQSSPRIFFRDSSTVSPLPTQRRSREWVLCYWLLEQALSSCL